LTLLQQGLQMIENDDVQISVKDGQVAGRCAGACACTPTGRASFRPQPKGVLLIQSVP
jgi:hypothetical protein